MRIALGCDHAGLELKEHIKAILLEFGHRVDDLGTHTKDSVDYPDFGLRVARAVADGSADRGIVICWTGNGMAMAANKVPGVRAGLALHPEMAVLARSHNDANVLALAQKYTPLNELRQILVNFLDTPFEGGRHDRRVQKMAEAERGEIPQES